MNAPTDIYEHLSNKIQKPLNNYSLTLFIYTEKCNLYLFNYIYIYPERWLVTAAAYFSHFISPPLFCKIMTIISVYLYENNGLKQKCHISSLLPQEFPPCVIWLCLLKLSSHCASLSQGTSLLLVSFCISKFLLYFRNLKKRLIETYRLIMHIIFILICQLSQNIFVCIDKANRNLAYLCDAAFDANKWLFIP